MSVPSVKVTFFGHVCEVQPNGFTDTRLGRLRLFRTPQGWYAECENVDHVEYTDTAQEAVDELESSIRECLQE